MVSARFVMLDELGIHMRPAKYLSTKALECSCKISINKATGSYNLKSVLSILSAGIRCGDEIVLECDGADEEKAMKELKELILEKLGGKLIDSVQP